MVKAYWFGREYPMDMSQNVTAGNLNAVRYRDEILRPFALSVARQNNTLFQYDNARSSAARIHRVFQDDENVHVIGQQIPRIHPQ